MYNPSDIKDNIIRTYNLNFNKDNKSLLCVGNIILENWKSLNYKN